MKPPIVFMSHASEDKPFVTGLSTRLRSDGVDAWVDQWEIAVGDKLVDKIFSEGIGKCNAFLIVLSVTSVRKRWVQEELNSGVVEAIERSAKLLPVRIDDCDVPTVLKSRKWLNMNPESYESEYRELLGAIFGNQNKPPLGAVPSIVSQQLSGYSVDESRILRFLVKAANESEGEGRVDAATLQHNIPGLQPEAMREAVQMLESDGNAEVQWFLGSSFHARLTPTGWFQFAGEILGFDPDDDLRLLMASAASDGVCNGSSLMQKTGLPSSRVVHGVKRLQQIGYLSVEFSLGLGALGGMWHITCTPQGRRATRH